MNTMQYEQLFTDLNPTQAETIAGGDFPIPIYKGPSRANAAFGAASATFARYPVNSYGSFGIRLTVTDKAKDGYSVYALVQGKTDNGRILSLPARHWQKQGGGTSSSKDFLVDFGKNNIQKIWVAILRNNPGKDLYVQGSWIYL